MSSRSPSSVLITGFAGSVGERLASDFSAASYDARFESWSEDVLFLIESCYFDVIIVGHPLPGVGFGLLLSSVRSRASACRRSGLLILVPPDDVKAVERLIGRGVNRVLADSASAKELLAAAESVHNVAPRHRLHLKVQLEVNLATRDLKTLCQTENISESGMLLRGFRHYPPGTVFSFEIQLPGEPVMIRGSAEVARNTNVEREKLTGFGARFLDLDEDGLDRLGSFLESISDADGVN